jgi:hypothetical protein
VTTVPQPFLSPWHPDDTPDTPTLLLNTVGGALREETDADGRIVRYRLDPASDATTSPLRRALRAAFLHRSPRDQKEN